MFKYNNQSDCSPFDGIILSFVKGGHRSNVTGVRHFQTLGDFDCFSVTPVLIDGDDIKTSGDLLYHVNKTLKMIECGEEEKSTEEDSSYHLIGLSKMSHSDGFWDEKNETAYTFVSLLQFGKEFKSFGFDESIRLLREYLDSKICGLSSDARYFIYFSMDVSDLILFVKTDSLDAGRTLLEVKKEFCHDIHCYSHSGLNMDKLRTSTCKIKEVMISSTVCNPDKYRQWHEEWKAQFPGVEIFERLGYEDFSIRLQNTKMEAIIELIENGLLSPKTFDGIGGYKGAIMRPRIIFDYDGTQSFSARVGGSCDNTILSRYKAEYEGKPGTQDIRRHMRNSMRMALLDMFKSVSMLEKYYYGRDVVQCIEASFDKFILELKAENTRIDRASMQGSEKDLLKVNKLILHRYLSKYLDANISIIQGALQAERMFFQVPGFNIKLYDLQSKLVVFYAALIKKMKSVLNDKDPGFDVVFNVGLHPQITFEELFSVNECDQSADDGALALINVPISSLYKVESLAMQIAHEIAHFSANEFRLRGERLGQIINIVSALVVDMFFGGGLDRENSQWVDAMKCLFPNVRDQSAIAQTIHSYVQEYIETLLPSPGGARPLRAVKIKERMVSILADFTGQAHMETLLLKLCEEIRQQRDPGIHEIPRFMDAISLFVCTIYENMELAYASKMPIKHICKLVVECYSDLVMVKLFEVKEDEYLKSFTRELDRIFSHQKYGEDFSDFTPQRVCSVFKACYGKEVLAYLENHPKIKTDVRLSGFRDAIERNVNKRGLANHVVLVKNTVAYLNACSKKWDEYFTGPSANPAKAGALDEVRDIFAWATGATNLEGFVAKFSGMYESFVKVNLPCAP